MPETKSLYDTLIQTLQNTELPEKTPLDILSSNTIFNNIIPSILPVLTAYEQAKQKTEKEGNAPLTRNLNDVSETLAPGLGFLLSTLLEPEVEITSERIAQIYREMGDIPVIGNINNFIVGFLTFATLMKSEFSAVAEKTRQSANIKHRPTLLPLETIIEKWHRFPELSEEIKKELERYGFTDTNLSQLLNTSFQLVDIGTLRVNYLRGKISEADVRKKLEEMRFAPDAIQQILFSFQIFPSPSDVIRFGVREIYNTDLRSSLGLDSETPENFISDMVKLGYSEQNAKNYWASHWNPISSEQAIRLFQRGKIDAKQRDELFKVNDVLPGHRELLTELSYNVISRVDLRRLYKSGIFNEEQVYKANLDYGYSPENAEHITRLVIEEYDPEDRELTRSVIISLYKGQILSRPETIDFLREIGYTEFQSQLLIENEEYKDEKRRQDKVITKYKSGFLKRKYSEAEVRSFLSSIGYNPSEVAEIIEDWFIELDSKRSLLTVGQITQMYKKHIILRETANEYLMLRNYTEEDAELLLTLWDSQIDEKVLEE